MPIFEYICKDCDAPFERIVPRHDSRTTCLKCGSKRVEKQLSVFAVAGGHSDTTGAFSESMSDDAGCGRCGSPSPGACGLPD